MREIFRKKLGNMAGFLLAAAVILLIVAALAILGGAVMRVFGFEYSSVWSVILFFIIATILSLPVSIFAEALPKVLLKNFGKPRHTAAALYIVLDTLATAQRDGERAGRHRRVADVCRLGRRRHTWGWQRKLTRI